MRALVSNQCANLEGAGAWTFLPNHIQIDKDCSLPPFFTLGYSTFLKGKNRASQVE